MSGQSLCGFLFRFLAWTSFSMGSLHLNSCFSKFTILVMMFSTIFLMNLWYIHLVVSNLNWLITAVSHLASLYYNVSLYMRDSSKAEPFEIRISAISIKVFVCIIYLLMNYYIDYKKKINFCITNSLFHVSSSFVTFV